MSPFQHGEVFVTRTAPRPILGPRPLRAFRAHHDWAQQQFHHRAHYERVIAKERRGDYSRHGAGYPAHHRRDQAQHQAGRRTVGCLLVEIGGTSVTSSPLPFLEAIRQLGVELGRNNCAFMH